MNSHLCYRYAFVTDGKMSVIGCRITINYKMYIENMPTENTRLINYKDNKATALIRGKSPPSEHVLDKINSKSSFDF